MHNILTFTHTHTPREADLSHHNTIYYHTIIPHAKRMKSTLNYHSIILIHVTIIAQVIQLGILHYTVLYMEY